jgi:hypothetical protein
MAQILIILVFYSICASTVLVWSTLLHEGYRLSSQISRKWIDYVAIPDHFLFEWLEQCPGIVIFDVHAGRGDRGWRQFVSHWLTISAIDLPTVLKWLPPASTVVFCCKDATEQIDTRTKTILLELGIGTVYFLDDSRVLQANSCCQSGARACKANQELRKRNMTTIKARSRL